MVILDATQHEPDDARELDALLSHADAATYRVKRAGGDHLALERNELHLCVQQVVHAGTQAVTARPVGDRMKAFR